MILLLKDDDPSLNSQQRALYDSFLFFPIGFGGSFNERI